MADNPNKKKKDSKQVSQQEWEKNYKRKTKGTVTKKRSSKSKWFNGKNILKILEREWMFTNAGSIASALETRTRGVE